MVIAAKKLEVSCSSRDARDTGSIPVSFFLMWTILIVFIEFVTILLWGFPGGTVVKNPPANAGDTKDMGSIPGWEDPLE